MDDSEAELLAVVAFRREQLTKRQREVLRLMAEAEEREDWDGAELVYERGRGYLDLDPVGARTIFALVRAMAIKVNPDAVGQFERYALTSEGRRIGKEMGR